MALKICISTYSFYPHVSPRAFRSFELAKGFASLGHEVTVFCAYNNKNYSDIENKYGFKVIAVKPGFFFNKVAKFTYQDNINKNKKHSLKRIFKYAFHAIYLGGKSFEYAFTLKNALIKNKFQYDLLLSIGLPISTHIGSALAKKKAPRIFKTMVADYGDPYSKNNSRQYTLFFHTWIEKWILRTYDYVTIPIDAVRKHYLNFKPQSKIITVPQGISYEHIKIPKYNKNSIPTFGYAGIFLLKLRDPTIFLEYLSTLSTPFKFVLYTNLNDKENMSILSKFKYKLKGKLVLNDFIPREECIIQLSKLDFLINVSNATTLQRPSKLIDYTISGRPIFNFSQDQLDIEDFHRFLNGNYSTYKTLDLKEFNINHICQKMITLNSKF